MAKLRQLWDRESTRLCDRAARLGRLLREGGMAIMRRRVKPRFWVFMICVTLVVFLASFLVMNRRCELGAQRLRQVREERDALILETNALSEKLEFARTDDYVIRTARDELGMIMPGEVRYVNGA